MRSCGVHALFATAFIAIGVHLASADPYAVDGHDDESAKNRRVYGGGDIQEDRIETPGTAKILQKLPSLKGTTTLDDAARALGNRAGTAANVGTKASKKWSTWDILFATYAVTMVLAWLTWWVTHQSSRNQVVTPLKPMSGSDAESK